MVTGEQRRAPDGPGQSEPMTEPIVKHTSEGSPAQLALLADEYARELVETLVAGPMRSRELVADCEGSRATVYRRLDRLVEAGFVRAELALDPDGHHSKVFRLVRDSLTVTVEDGGLSVTARP